MTEESKEQKPRFKSLAEADAYLEKKYGIKGVDRTAEMKGKGNRVGFQVECSRIAGCRQGLDGGLVGECDLQTDPISGIGNCENGSEVGTQNGKS